MNSFQDSKKNLIFADGGEKQGFGHLIRVINLSKILKIQSSSIFIFENSEQQKFYKTQNVSCFSISDIPNEQYQILIIDSKFRKTALQLNLKKRVSKTLIIDNIAAFKDSHHFLALPSFFENPESINIEHLNKKKILLGPEYLILNPKIYDVTIPKRKEFLTISFGGSDPNNLTLFTLKLLQGNSLLPNIVVILGPGYKHNRSEIEKIINKKQILDNPQNIYEIFAKSFIVITAFGVTLQELFYLNTSAGIIANYKDDFDDYLRIEGFFKKTNKQNFFSFFGILNNVDRDKMLSAIQKSKTEMSTSQLNKDYGSGWKAFRKKMIS